MVGVDVVVVGAGTAGTHAAAELARTGRSVVLVERRPAGKGGARWCNGVVPWQLEAAGIALSAGDEVRSRGGAVHFVSPSGRHRFTLPDSPIWEVDMRLLGDRLLAGALDAGVEPWWEVTDAVVRLDQGRPVALTLTHEGRRRELQADLFVDASGRRGAIRDQVPAFGEHIAPFAPHELCSAQQLVLRVDDADGARRFLDDHGARPGEAVDAMGVAGGYSVQVVRVEPDLEEVSVLVGAIADGRDRSGPELMREVRHANPWIGPAVFGGGALIPLRRVADRLAAPGVALVGDAASQVMAAHGSGIGFGLIAGRMLAEATAGAADPGALEPLWAYQAAYLRTHGPTLGAYDAFRRMSVDLGTDGVEELFAARVFGPELVEPGLHQRLETPPPAVLAHHAAQLARRPRLGRIAGPALARAGLAQASYATYPTAPDPRRLTAWARHNRRLLGG